MKLICFFLGHNYFLKKRLNFYSRCVGCKRCRNYFAMNDDVRIILPWDIEFSELYKYNPYLENFDYFPS